MYVSTILKIKGTLVHTVAPDATLADAAKSLLEKGIGALVVSKDGSDVVGILSERDIVHAIAGSGENALSQAVSERMSKNVVTCAPGDNIADIMSTMTEKRIRHLPTISDDKLAGIISIGDVVKFRLEEVEAEAGAMRDMITGH